MTDFYKLEKPKLDTVDANKPLRMYFTDPGSVLPFIEKSFNPRYLYWTDLKHRPAPKGLSPEEFWVLVKFIRQTRSTPSFVKDESGKMFSWVKLERHEELLHRIDMAAGGRLFVSGEARSTLVSKSDEYLVHGMVEEAIASSLLEGAHTTRRAAKKIILEGRPPKTPDERMVLNNYKVIQRINSLYKDAPMTEGLILELHKLLTEGTDIEIEAIGRFRTDEDDIEVGDHYTTTHYPPKEEFMRTEIMRFFEVANESADRDHFLHPVIKAVMLHFWIGYLHPFVDGNGRLARAIFYWYLLKHDYGTIMYLPISGMIRKSPDQYSDAYVRTEQDDLDLSYFIDYHLQKIESALDDFENFLRKKVLEQRKVETAARADGLNPRQKTLVAYLASHPREYATITTHQRRHNISAITARKDLYGLTQKGFLRIEKQSGYFVRFYPTEKTMALGQ